MSSALRKIVYNRGLHWIARIALRVQAPVDAKRTVDWFGHRLPRFDGIDEARGAARTLGSEGTCLSRSLTIAARTLSAHVVVGVDPRTSSRLFAHAWVEVGGQSVEDVVRPPWVEELARLE